MEKVIPSLVHRLFQKSRSNRSNNADRVVCKECKEPLRAGARKCAQCGFDQRPLTLNSIALFVGAVLSVFSLTAVGFSVTKKLLDPKVASLSGAVASGDPGAIYFTVSNKGTRAAAVIDVVVEGPFTDPSCRRPITFGTRVDPSAIVKVIEPGKMYAMVARRTGGFAELPSTFAPEARLDRNLPEKLGNGMTCRLSVSYIDFDNQVKRFAIPYPCLPQAPCRG